MDFFALPFNESIVHDATVVDENPCVNWPRAPFCLMHFESSVHGGDAVGSPYHIKSSTLFILRLVTFLVRERAVRACVDIPRVVGSYYSILPDDSTCKGMSSEQYLKGAMTSLGYRSLCTPIGVES